MTPVATPFFFYLLSGLAIAGGLLVITRRNARSVVLMSEEDYDGLMETVHLLNSPANAGRLLRAIADADRDMLTNARSPWPSRAERAR